MADVETELAVELARLIRAHRLAAGLTLEEVATRAGLHRTSLGLVERGERKLTVGSAKRLADALGRPLWTLVQEAEEACQADSKSG